MKISIKSASNNLINCVLQVNSPILFDIDFQLDLIKGDQQQSFHIRQKNWDISWLLKGTYQLSINLNESEIQPNDYTIRIVVMDNANTKPRILNESTSEFTLENTRKVLSPSIHWDISSTDFDINKFSWKKGHSDWFYRHFDHASRVIKDLMFASSDALKGKILDVGCGDGITDLGLYLRTQPELLVGIDPFEGFKNLNKFCNENNLPTSLINHDNLIFSNASGNNIPYKDNYFDVVLSWGSLEHIAGGYKETLTEITRVLKPGGILFAHPGLFYGEYGNHLGEFFDDPFIHLKIPHKELKMKLLQSEANYMDRSGQTFPPEDYWKWYTELNPITVDSLEKELKNLGYEPWRIALRSSNMIEYTQELQKFPINDLAVREMYATFILK
ncbi:MAG: methyltransferase domain-containing protein [Proteobacteria bacterium]|nr:methyltransferase domain-containing protein [Pseudomonadota bacterium]